MILAASMVVRNELSRYLPLVIEHLRGFCDQISVLDDGSTDGTLQYLQSQIDGQLSVRGNPSGTFDLHEGQTRQALLDFTLERAPTHVLAIDGDEFISDGQALRALLEAQPAVGAWALRMTEIWNVTEDGMQVRLDGAWHPYQRVHVWAVPSQLNANWRIMDRPLACSPVPRAVLGLRPQLSGISIYHFGWADPATRQARYDRYMSLDGGRFHARSHLQSIMYPEHKIRREQEAWPATHWAAQVREKLVG